MLNSFTFAAAKLERIFNMLPAVQSIGFLPQKADRVDYSFRSCNFSFILEGEGEYILHGRKYEVKAPCMLVQWPGEPMYYGPKTTWSEVYFIYPEETFANWQQAKMLLPSDPVRHMSNASNVQQKIMELYKLLSGDFQDGDRLDMLCYSLILETYSTERSRLLDNTLIPEIRKRLTENIHKDIDCRKLAKEFNMSLSTLRRYYRKYCGNETFMQYRNSFFLQQSCRLLLETELTVKEIARELKFDDPFYFSRKFHQLAGSSPLSYRKKFRR